MISMIIINQIKISSKLKVIFYIITNLLILFFIHNSPIDFIELSIVMFCSLFLFANCYTIRYSSLRIRILNDLIRKKKIISESQLYNERISRFKQKNSNLMNQNFFIIFNLVASFFKKIFI